MMSETRPAAAAIAPAQSQRRSSFQIHMADAESVHRHLVRTAERDERQLVRRLKRLQLKMLLTLVEELNAILGTDMQPIHKPARVGDIVHSGANINKARELLDFAPRTSFSEGLQQTVAAYQQTTA